MSTTSWEDPSASFTASQQAWECHFGVRGRCNSRSFQIAIKNLSTRFTLVRSVYGFTTESRDEDGGWLTRMSFREASVQLGVSCVLKALENNKKKEIALRDDDVGREWKDYDAQWRQVHYYFICSSRDRRIIVHKTQPTKQGRWRIAWLSSALCVRGFMIYALELTLTSWRLMILDQGLWQSIWWKLNYLDLDSAREARQMNNIYFFLVLKNRILNSIIEKEQLTINLKRIPITICSLWLNVPILITDYSKTKPFK